MLYFLALKTMLSSSWLTKPGGLVLQTLNWTLRELSSFLLWSREWYHNCAEALYLLQYNNGETFIRLTTHTSNIRVRIRQSSEARIRASYEKENLKNKYFRYRPFLAGKAARVSWFSIYKTELWRVMVNTLLLKEST